MIEIATFRGVSIAFAPHSPAHQIVTFWTQLLGVVCELHKASSQSAVSASRGNTLSLSWASCCHLGGLSRNPDDPGNTHLLILAASPEDLPAAKCAHPTNFILWHCAQFRVKTWPKHLHGTASDR